jgi:hypothetical protein
MHTVWERDVQGLPVRHLPGRPHGDLWISQCSNEPKYKFVFLMDSSSLKAVMELTPCLDCVELEKWSKLRPISAIRVVVLVLSWILWSARTEGTA